jgi:DNA mismatch repair ATPase MutS
MDFYTTRIQLYKAQLKKLRKTYNTISLFRLLAAVGLLFCVYFSFVQQNRLPYMLGAIVFLVLFIILMYYHSAISQKRRQAEALVQINRDELQYLEQGVAVFDDGAEYTDPNHSYSYDLDIFGRNSLFHSINRTETYKGKGRLAQMLLSQLNAVDILSNQEAIKELATLPESRQEIMALGKTGKDSATVYNRLLQWAGSTPVQLSAVVKAIAFIMPVAFVGSLIAYIITGNTLFSNGAGYVFGFNLLFILGAVKRIKNEVKDNTEIHTIISRYGQTLAAIESANFTSNKLKALQQDLATNNQKASVSITKLGWLFSQMDSMNNVFGAALMNGTLLYHLHIFNALLQWKKDHAAHIAVWLDTIAEVEALGSFANMYYNNPDFTFPELNANHSVAFKDLAHPLLKKEVRVGNDITFSPAFTILTGSNMSGKSTFLRSLGVNMVLAGTGSPVCASYASVYPMQLLVSMRLSDSLVNSESYFFAEIKRLKTIMEAQQNERAFVLLDEILRGTNSDDKQTGTIAVVKKMVQLKAVGAIATHDIEVCATALDYPQALVNRCFEAQIINDELYFDYRLRDGICKNKSATFLMQKMGVI